MLKCAKMHWSAGWQDRNQQVCACNTSCQRHWCCQSQAGGHPWVDGQQLFKFGRGGRVWQMQVSYLIGYCYKNKKRAETGANNWGGEWDPKLKVSAGTKNFCLRDVPIVSDFWYSLAPYWLGGFAWRPEKRMTKGRKFLCAMLCLAFKLRAL